MKIGPLENKPAVATTATERKADPAKIAGGTANREASAKVELSSTAASMSGGAATEASFDQAKVDRIAQAIRDGNYKINAEAIADKLISNAQELLGKAGG
jgi:negative regulator of flagellin synthesis FlgM